MKHFLTNFLRMGSTVSTPPIRLKMRSVLLVLGLLLGSLSMWGADVVIDLDLSNSTTYPSGFPTSTGTKSGTYKFWGYDFSFLTYDGLYFNSGGYLMIGKSGYNSETSASYIAFPAISGYKLKEVIISTTSNGSTNVSVSIRSNYSTTLTGGTAWVYEQSTTHTWALSNTSDNTSYRMYFQRKASGNTVNAQLASLKLTYEPASVTPTCTDPTTPLSITSADEATIGTPLTLTSNGGNGGAIVWSVEAGTGTASVEGNVLTPLTKGTVTVTATQGENTVGTTTYCEAAPTQEITINKAAPTPIVGGLIDQLSISTFGVTGSGSYTAFTNKSASNSGHSPAVYAGTVARNGNSTKYNIQLNSGQTSSKLREIATSASGGFAKRVYVTWATESTNSSDRKLTVYGSNTAYNGSETASAGTKIGDIVFNTGDAYEYLDIVSNYKYIQIVASSAIYMDQIDITWVPIPTYAVNLSNTGCTLNVQKGSTPVADNDKFEEGTQLTVSYSASEGYENASLKVKKTSDMSDVTTSVLSGSTLTMPAYGITIEATATKKQYTVTLAATNGKIQVGGEEKASISVAHGETAELTAEPNTDYAFNGWTSSNANVVLTDATVNPATITVTGEGTITANFISTAKFNPGFAWSVASAEAVKGQEASLPTLTTNPYSLTPTYVSTNTDVAEINNAGEVTIKAVGSTTIKATYAEDATYADCEATYTLTVKGRVTWHIIKEGTDETSYADYAAGTVPTKPVGVTSCDASSISLVGWTNATYAKSDVAPATLYTEDVPAVTDNADYYAVWGVSSADSEASISEGVDTDGIINESGWTNSGAGSYASSGHGLKFDTQGDYITSPNISSENLKSVVVKFKAGYNSSQNSGSIFTIYSYDSDDNVLDSKTCEPETDYNDQNDYSYTLSGSATIAYVKIALTTRVANVGMEYAELFKIIPGSTSGYTTNCVPPMTVATPTFTPDGSAAYYIEAQTVTISCATNGAKIYYSLDGSEPSVEYTAPIPIGETKTLKAKAVLEDVSSEIAEATFTINLPVSTIQALQSHANGDLDFKFENILVTAVTSEKQAFISDGTYGAIIYINAGHGLTEGDLINSKSGTAYATTLTKYNGAAELTVFDAESDKLTITSGQTVPVQNKTIDALSVGNIGMIVDLGNLTYDATDKKFIDASSHEIAYYDAYKLNLTLEDGAVYAVKGLVNRYNTTLQISPRSAEDLVKQTAKEAATGQWYVSSSKETAINGTYTINEDAEFAPFFDTNSDGEKTYGSTNTSVATIVGGTLVITGAGTTVISCEIAESENYYARSAVSFTLKVKAAGSGDATWVAATWASDNSIAANSKMNVQSPIAIDANLSMTWSKAEGSNDPIYHSDGEGRLYQKNTLTITASNSKQITRIVFHFTGNNKGTISANEGEYSNDEWTGFVSSVTFTNANGASGARIQSIDIEYAQGTTTTLEIEDIVLLATDGATPISFTSNKPGAVVTYSEYDEAVITITDGKITPVAIGNTTVKASIAAEAPYSSATITFNVRVKSSTETVETVVILSQFGDKLLAMKHDFTAVEVERAADGTIIDLSADEADIQWIMISDGGSAMFQQPGTNKFMAVGSSNALTLVDEATTWTLHENGYYYNESGRTFLYQGNGAKYKNYSAGNAGKATDGGYSGFATFVEPVFANRADIRSGLFDGKWGTICPKQEVKYPTGASFYQLTYMELNTDGSPYKFFFDEIAENASLEAGKPYLFIADGEVIKGVKVGGSVSNGDYAHNGFVGYIGEGKHISSENDVYTENAINYYGLQNNVFKLIYSTSSIKNILDERAYVEISPTRMPSTTALPMPAYSKRRLVVGAGAPAVTTGMDELNASEAPVKVMIDGQLFIIRGEKMYNANGQLVK